MGKINDNISSTALSNKVVVEICSDTFFATKQNYNYYQIKQEVEIYE